MTAIGAGRIDKSVFFSNFNTILLFYRSSEDNISLELSPDTDLSRYGFHRLDTSNLRPYLSSTYTLHVCFINLSLFVCVASKLSNSIVDKKNQLDVTFCILYFSSNSCSTCFGQPCAHHQELTTA